MKPKISYGGENVAYSSNVWLCRCKKCDMSFFSKQTRIVCESCENIEKRDEKLDDLLNNNNPEK
jgi:Zn finger protein HypA/HybF involved in hydrogenase expression